MKHDNLIRLTPEEIDEGRAAGIARHEESVKHKRKASAGLPQEKSDSNEGLKIDILGGIGERAVAKFLDVPFEGGLNIFHGPDLKQKIQVRATEKDWGCLIIRPGDNRDHNYVLVTVDLPYCNVRGWIPGKEADDICKPEAKVNRDPALFVRQRQLRPMDQLPIK